MKTALFAAALTMAGAAFAQTTGTTAAQPSTATQTSAPGNQAPARDARGIPVVSAPAEVPAGANQSPPVQAGAVFQPNPNQQQVFTPRPAEGEFPPCSRTVTDRCVQTYERGRGPN
ncbi:hypothetical protein [Sphingosinicella terrae]|uniref:hypothetical protein n=1 Tax=Sphingosinicella terrae TaxID=2172047 RepID=UPI0013B45A02|nr:hypothetical protein [Sphingosinicella terrae]